MQICDAPNKCNIMSPPKAMMVSPFRCSSNSSNRRIYIDNGAYFVQRGKPNRQSTMLQAPAPPRDQKPDRQRINSNTADGGAEARSELSRTDPGVQALHDLSRHRHGGTKPPPSHRQFGRPPSGRDNGTVGGLSSKNLTSDRRGLVASSHSSDFTGAMMHTRPGAGADGDGERKPIKLETAPAESPRLSSTKAQSWPAHNPPGWRPVEVDAYGRRRPIGTYQQPRLARSEEIEQKVDSESRTRPLELHRAVSTPLPTPPLYATSRSTTASSASNSEPLRTDGTFDGSRAVKLEGGGRMYDKPSFAAMPTNRAMPSLSRPGRRRTAPEAAELLRERYNLLSSCHLGLVCCFRVLKRLVCGQHPCECHCTRSCFLLLWSPVSLEHKRPGYLNFQETQMFVS